MFKSRKTNVLPLLAVSDPLVSVRFGEFEGLSVTENEFAKMAGAMLVATFNASANKFNVGSLTC